MKRVAIALVLTAALSLGSCSLLGGGEPNGGGTTGGGGPAKFTQVTGSGCVTVRIRYAGTMAFSYGANGIKWGQYERLGGNVGSLPSSDVSYVITDQAGADYLFTGGQVIGSIGGTIDVNANDKVDDGDRVALVQNYTVSGNGTVTLDYPVDFSTVSGSAYLTVRLKNATGKAFSYGASGIKWGQNERLGGNVPSVASADESYVITDTGGKNFLFAGGQILGGIGGMIDENANGKLDDGDRIALIPNYTVNGNATITLNYRGDFTTVSGSDYLTVNVSNANSAHPGKPLMYGVSGIQWGQYERMGTNTTITSDSMSLRIQNTGVDFLFGGGQVIGGVGAIIDTNGNGFPDDGDYIAIAENVTVNTGTTVSFTY